ncbi:hypothetical protein LX32DRAFT_289869 [Colletotrichum zoysiae]|uniref:Uncharacterized protein n=1 Tax=Colletotrichum zoysiae TaxID=1216348 RepID=A0AAD9H1Q5_9PEZI|nr:hypothetical protein LX32DRAFT_289869 [Colletotrichum zoysiae]
MVLIECFVAEAVKRSVRLLCDRGHTKIGKPMWTATLGGFSLEKGDGCDDAASRTCRYPSYGGFRRGPRLYRRVIGLQNPHPGITGRPVLAGKYDGVCCKPLSTHRCASLSSRAALSDPFRSTSPPARGLIVVPATRSSVSSYGTASAQPRE